MAIASRALTSRSRAGDAGCFSSFVTSQRVRGQLQPTPTLYSLLPLRPHLQPLSSYTASLDINSTSIYLPLASSHTASIVLHLLFFVFPTSLHPSFSDPAHPPQTRALPAPASAGAGSNGLPSTATTSDGRPTPRPTTLISCSSAHY